MKDEKLHLGNSMAAFVSRPASGLGKNPGVLVFQEAFGVNGHIQDVCRKFSERGYVAMAPELFHRLGEGTVFGYDEFSKIRPLLGGLTTPMLLEDARVAFEALQELDGVDPDRVSAVGFCMGGYMALLSASHLPLFRGISFYGGGVTDPRQGIGFTPILKDFKGISCPVYLGFGGADPSISPAQIEKMRDRLASLKKNFEIEVYPDAKHGFLCDARPAYNAAAAARAWARIFEFLEGSGGCGGGLLGGLLC